MRASTGIHYVFVNGTAVVSEGAWVKSALPGRAVRIDSR